MTSLLSDITKRAEGLAKGEPTMDSHESLFRAVLRAIQGGAVNPQELVAAALKADAQSTPSTQEVITVPAKSKLGFPQGSALITLTEALDKVEINYLLRKGDYYWFLFIAPRAPLHLAALGVLAEDVSREVLELNNRFMEFDESGDVVSY